MLNGIMLEGIGKKKREKDISFYPFYVFFPKKIMDIHFFGDNFVNPLI